MAIGLFCVAHLARAQAFCFADFMMIFRTL